MSYWDAEVSKFSFREMTSGWDGKRTGVSFGSSLSKALVSIFAAVEKLVIDEWRPRPELSMTDVFPG